MDLRGRMLGPLAGQLGHPRGVPGALLGRLLNHGNRELIAAAVDEIALAPDAAAADLGFGGGRGLDLLLRRLGPQGTVHGVEISTAMLAAARRRQRRAVSGGRLLLHHAVLEALPLAVDSLDGAMTLNTIYFVADPSRVLRELARVLRPGGRLALGLGDPDAMARMPFTEHGFRLRPVDELVAAASGAGLTLQNHREVGSGHDACHLLVLTA